MFMLNKTFHTYNVAHYLQRFYFQDIINVFYIYMLEYLFNRSQSDI